MISIALIGYGYWGPQLARNLALLSGARLAMVADPSLDRLALCRDTHPGVALREKAEEAFASPAIDAVVIATPASTHFALARAALRAGKHVLVEKPFATSTAEAEVLVEESIRRRRVLMVDHTYVPSPAVQAMRRLVSAGTLGTPTFYDSARLSPGLIRPDVNVIWDLAAHDFAILDHLIPAAPESITVTGTVMGPGHQVQAAWLIVRYPGGFTAHLHASWLSPTKTRRILLGGSERILVFDDQEPTDKIRIVETAQVPGQRAGRAATAPPVPTIAVDPAEPLRLQLEQFVQSIATGAPAPCDARSGLRVVRWLEAAEESLRTGGPVLFDAPAEAAA